MPVTAFLPGAHLGEDPSLINYFHSQHIQIQSPQQAPKLCGIFQRLERSRDCLLTSII